MVKASWGTARALVLAHEGGFVNHPRDPGGATFKGVTQRVYDAYRRSEGKPLRSVRFAEDAEIFEIYEEQYAAPIKFDKLPAGLDYAVYDCAVNSGVSRASKLLQRVLRMNDVDGVIGLVTIGRAREAAAKNEERLIAEYCKARYLFVSQLDTFDVFGKGWTRRIDEVEVGAIKLARADTEFNMPAAAAGKAYKRAA